MLKPNKGVEYYWCVESTEHWYSDDEYRGDYGECLAYARVQYYTNENCQLAFAKAVDGEVWYIVYVDTEWECSGAGKENVT